MGLVGLLNDGFDVADLRDRFKNRLVLASVIPAFLLGLFYLLIMVLQKSAAEACFLSLRHVNRPQYTLLSLCFFSFFLPENSMELDMRRRMTARGWTAMDGAGAACERWR